MLVWRAHENPETVPWKTMEKDERRRGSQDLLLKLSHARVARRALRNTQQRGIFCCEDIRGNTGVFGHVRQEFSSCAEQKKGP